MAFNARLLVSLVCLCSCLESTQVTFEITTDLECSQVTGTSLTVGVEGETEKAQPVTVTTQCATGETFRAIGTYAIVPRAGASRVGSIKVALAVGGLDVETACTAANRYQGCVVARRRVSFVKQRSLTVPIELLANCTGVACDENSTCSRAGRCVTSMVDVDKCHGQKCDTLVTKPGEGLPCGVDGQGNPVLCRGELEWCTIDSAGQRGCARVPADGGTSFQCRVSADCGVGLNCVPGVNGILGVCQPPPVDGGVEVVLCRPGESANCSGGICATDAGQGLLSCTAGCVSASERLCEGACRACPQGPGVTSTACAATTCIAASCSPGFVLMGQSCVFVPTYRQQAYVKLPEVDAGTTFGSDVSMSNDGTVFAVAGQPRTVSRGGAVYVFSKADGGWQQSALVRSPDAGPTGFDGYGTRAVLSGDGRTLVVGANQKPYDFAADSGRPRLLYAGTAYVFTRGATGWQFEAELTPLVPGDSDIFGTGIDVADDGNTVAISAPLEQSGGDAGDRSKPSSGAVYVFTRTGAQWSQQAYLKPAAIDVGDGFGGLFSVVLSADGHTLAAALADDSSAVGVNGDATDNSLLNSGAVVVFTRTGSTWAQQSFIKASNPKANADFGSALSLSADGKTLAVGAKGEPAGSRGVGATETGSEAPAAGAAYVFTFQAGSWAQQTFIKASNAEAGDRFGHNVALSADGTVLTVSAPGEASKATGLNGVEGNNSEPASGAVYRFLRMGNSWVQTHYIKASNAQADDLFGVALALSANGEDLVCLAPNEKSAATGVNGDQQDNSVTGAGAAYVFQWATTPQ